MKINNTEKCPEKKEKELCVCMRERERERERRERERESERGFIKLCKHSNWGWERGRRFAERAAQKAIVPHAACYMPK